MADVFRFLELLLGKKIIIFGTGKASEIISSKLPLAVEYYVDNDSTKWGNNFMGKDIKSPEVLAGEDKDMVFIIISSMYHEDISAQLEAMGFIRNQHFFNAMKLYERIIKRDNSTIVISGARNEHRDIELFECKWATSNELIRFMESGIISEDKLGMNYWGLKGFGYGYILTNVAKISRDVPLRVLDVGGGYSTLGAELSDRFGTESWLADDFGVESNEPMWTVNFQREKLREKNKSIRYVFERLGDIRESSLPMNYFDVVYSVSALEHVPIQQWEAIFDHMVLLLKPNGLMIHTVDLNADKFEAWKVFLGNYISKGACNSKIRFMNNLDMSRDEDPALVEPMNIVYKYYYRGNENIEKKYSRIGSLCLVMKVK